MNIPAIAFTGEERATSVAHIRPRNASQKYSKVENESAISASGGARIISDSVIDVRGLAKSYRSYPGAVSRLRAALLPNLRNRGMDHWVLREVDLTVERGETVGIIGRNGSGKSTLLKLITGALHPTEGEIRVKGRVLALLELGTGMNPDLSGRQNVLFSAQLHALDEDKIASRMGEIEAFAELGEYFDAPVRTYSSGMFVRLAFSSFIFMEPQVLIIDEAHLLAPDQLEELRLLTNAEMDSQSPFALLLVGQPTLARQLRLGVFAALDQQIATRYQVAPMDLAESAQYLRHHLALVSRTDPLFADHAVARLHKASLGLPRALNNAAVAA